MRSAAPALRLLQTVVAINFHMARGFIALTYQISNIGRTLPGNNFFDHAYVGAAPTTSSWGVFQTAVSYSKPTIFKVIIPISSILQI